MLEGAAATERRRVVIVIIRITAGIGIALKYC